MLELHLLPQHTPWILSESRQPIGLPTMNSLAHIQRSHDPQILQVVAAEYV